RAGDEPPVRAGDALARRAARTAAAGGPVRGRAPAGRLGAGADGPGLGRLSAPVAAVRSVSARLWLRGAEDGNAGTLPVEDEEGRAASSARPRLFADRWRGTGGTGSAARQGLAGGDGRPADL